MALHVLRPLYTRVRALYGFLMFEYAAYFRCRHVRDLEIETTIGPHSEWPPTPEFLVVLERVASVLKHCNNLYALFLERHAIKLFNNTAIIEAIGTLRSIHVVSIAAGGEEFENSEATPLLRSISSPTAVVSLFNSICPDPSDMVSVSGTFAHMSSSLKCLDLGLSVWDPQPDIVFDKLVTLSTNIMGDIQDINTAVLFHMFPNLQFLSLEYSGLRPPNFEERTELSRRMNVQSQRRQSWTNLHTVRAEVCVLYALGLTCPVRHVELIDRLSSGVDSSDMDRWATVLKDCNATAATVQVATQDRKLERLPSIVPTTRTITRLILRIPMRIPVHKDIIVGSSCCSYLLSPIQFSDTMSAEEYHQAHPSNSSDIFSPYAFLGHTGTYNGGHPARKKAKRGCHEVLRLARTHRHGQDLCYIRTFASHHRVP
ncbi:hypothetical protein K474DRAFT_344491 [Panus rudis PR-1116 ss-1]|nr:hypothetical protein K474DRAFT_344491 [Panus rudis PR-1116 ss-1]